MIHDDVRNIYISMYDVLDMLDALYGDEYDDCMTFIYVDVFHI